MKALVLRLDAPLMSFGTVIVDHHGFIDDFPGLSTLTGLFANALGWNHSDWELLNDLQERLDFAARWDVRPEKLVDYQTVDLGSPKMRAPGWTTHGDPEHRTGGQDAKFGTHQRYRHFWMDGVMTVVVSLAPGKPTIDRLKEALENPARPLFLGRKSCLPARPLLDPVSPIVEGTDTLSVLFSVPVWNRNGSLSEVKEPLLACWSSSDTVSEDRGEQQLVYDLRDWQNQLLAGSRWRVRGMIGGGQ